MANLLKRTFSAVSKEPSASGEAAKADAEPHAGAPSRHEDMSAKLAGGMDRWQTTLDDIIHLRSSNNNVFKDHYWAQNGFDELRRYVKQGSDFSKELASILQERVEAEANYAKCLAKLGTKLGKACKESVGSCADAWRHVAREMDKRAEIHRNYSTALSEELVKPMRHVIDTQLKLRKKIEGDVDKSCRSLAEWRVAEAKAKRHSHSAARDNERLQDATLDSARLARSSSAGHLPHAHAHPHPLGDKDSTKLRLKRRKTEEAVHKAELDYYGVCVHAERARLEWETSVTRGSGMLEALEEERAARAGDAAGAYLRLARAVPPALAAAVRALQAPADAASAARDMRVVRAVAAAHAHAHPADQLLPDFYCEHTTLAMNRDRRKQALLKILQLVSQDIDKEHKSKEGLEKLSAAIRQTPTFGGDDSQQNVADKVYHVNSMLMYLEAVRYKAACALRELDARAPAPHPLAAHVHVARDRHGARRSVLRVPASLRAALHAARPPPQRPQYAALARSLSAASPSPSAAPPGAAPPPPPPPPPLPSVPPPDSPLAWSERGAGDGLSNRHDSDFDEFSSQSDSSTDLPEMLKAEEEGEAKEAEVKFGGDEAAGAEAEAQAQTAGTRKCRALYAYEARLDDELTLAPGDVIEIHSKLEDGWWSGFLNGTFGIFPSSYVEEGSASG